MTALATALINMAAFIELSDDEVIDPDSAVSALEQLAYDLRDVSPAEVECLNAALQEEIGKLPPDEDRREQFLSGFLENLGIGSA